jgi:hypothetical protein
MFIDIHRSVNIERHKYLLDQAEQWRLAKLADFIRRGRKVEKKALIQLFAPSKPGRAVCCDSAAA